MIIAILGLAAASAGTWGAVATADANDLEVTNASLKRQNDTLAEENSTLRDELATLTEDRDTWREKAEGAGPDGSSTPDAPDQGGGTSSPPATTGPRSRTSTVFRQSGDAPVTFSHGYSIDLDSDASDWSVVNGTSTGWDLYYTTSGGPQLHTHEVSLVDHVPTETECDDATVLQPVLTREQTRQDVQMCMRTSDDRFAYVRIAEINEEADAITVDIIVWD